ncbi:hypothetical protein DERP_000267 [Dermatophagoides pteronyssinus]|uniref:Uncharacterized protein n=1 Tax=Dermatophagoides pteronyssinus TaxID=6956 RepID=A0ABQ8IZN8_DERPT|nr:hypothetical protein DERP_000267 [Dermatophagoides pteronyssinus]
MKINSDVNTIEDKVFDEWRVVFILLLLMLGKPTTLQKYLNIGSENQDLTSKSNIYMTSQND